MGNVGSGIAGVIGLTRKEQKSGTWNVGLGTWDLELGTERERKKEHGGTLRHKMLYRSQAQEIKLTGCGES